MEQNNKRLIFTVICNEERYLNQVIEWYNSSYKTDFRIIRIINDEVGFAEIEVTKYNESDLFDLGYQVGVKEQRLRQEGTIDW